MKRYLVVLLLTLWACKDTEKSRQEIKEPDKEQNLPQYGTLVFNCDQEYQFTIRMEGQEAWVYTADTTIRLEHKVSASGIKYSNEETTFWSKGNEAQLEIGDSIYRNCLTKNLSDIQTNDRPFGTTFVAMGNEPDWHLEIYENERIQLTIDYGQKRYVFNEIKKTLDKKKRTVFYTARKDEHYLSVQILDTPCSDSMSSENFSKTVQVLFDQKAYQGCGAMFH